MTIEERKQQKIDRYLNAVACKEVDFTPVHLSGTVAICRTIDPSIRPGDLYREPERCMDIFLKACEELEPEQVMGFEYPPTNYFLARASMGDVKIPGLDLPMDSYWQMDEYDWFKPEFYDIVAEGGLKAFDELKANYIPPITMEIAADVGARTQMINEKYAASTMPRLISSMPVFSGHQAYLNFARGFAPFLRDLRKIPEKTVAACYRLDDDVFETQVMPALNQGIESLQIFLSRCDQDAMSFKTFEKYMWPAYALFQERLEKYSPNTILTFHIDGNYTDFIINLADQFRPGKTILQFDGMANAEKMAPALIKNNLCFFGDVPPSLLTLGTPQEVKDYVKKLQDIYGNGLIIAAGCTMPPDSKPENVRAMVEAAHTR